MKKTTSLLVLFILMLHVSCCTKAPEESGKTLCRINDFHLTLDEFEQQLTAEQELDPAFKLTREAKMAFLEKNCLSRKQENRSWITGKNLSGPLSVTGR